MKLLSRFAVLFFFIVAEEAEAAPIIRESGAIYLSDFGQKPLRLRVLRPAPCYFDIGMTRYAGTAREEGLTDRCHGGQTLRLPRFQPPAPGAAVRISLWIVG